MSDLREAFEALDNLHRWADDHPAELGEDADRWTETVKAALCANGGEAVPFAYCYTDVNGRAKELCHPPECASEGDKRVITALYTHPAPPSVAVPEEVLAERGTLVDLLRDASANEGDCDTCYNEPNKSPRLAVALAWVADWLESVAPAPGHSGDANEQHPDDAAVDRFAAAMKAKLAKARDKGRGGWDDPGQCSVEFLADLLLGHIGKGNPGNFEDIANLAMMLHQRGAEPSVLTQSSHIADAGKVAPSDWSGWACHKAGKMPRLYGEKSIAEVNCDTENGERLIFLTATPSVPEEEVRNVTGVEQTIDMTVEARFTSCRAAGEFAARLRTSQQEGSTAADDGEGV